MALSRNGGNIHVHHETPLVNQFLQLLLKSELLFFKNW